jgi:hypothetical protein
LISPEGEPLVAEEVVKEVSGLVFEEEGEEEEGHAGEMLVGAWGVKEMGAEGA